MSTLIRLLRILDLMDGVERLVPETGPRPMALLKLKGKERKRSRSAVTVLEDRVFARDRYGG